MSALSEYSNDYNTALLILRSKGFQLWFDPATEDYCAERDGWDFRSRSPCGLLGLVAIFEHHHPDQLREYWWRLDGPDLYRSLPQAPERAYRPLTAPGDSG